MKLIIIAVVLIIGAFVLYQRDLSKQEAVKEAQRIEQEERELQRVKEEKALLLEKERIEKEKAKQEAERKKEEERIRKENEQKAKQEEERKIAEQEKAEAQKQLELKLQKEKEEAERLAKEEAARLEAQCPECDGTGKVFQTVGNAKMKVSCSLCDGTGKKPNLSESKVISGNENSSGQIKKLQDYIEKIQANNQALSESLTEIEKFSSMVDNFMNSNPWYFSPTHARKTRTKGVNDEFNYHGKCWPTMREIYKDWEGISEKIYKKTVSLNAPRNVNSPLRLLNNKCSMNPTPKFAVPQIKEEADKSIDWLKKHIESQKSEIDKARAKLSEIQNATP